MQWPKRLENELQALRALARDIEIDDQLFAAGRVVIRARLPVADELVDLVIEYPDLFPYLRPEVKAPAWSLGRHQHPFEKNLCLINRSTSHWSPSYTAARLIDEQLPRLLKAVADGDAAAELEEHQGEPLAEFFSYFPESIVLVDSDWAPPAGARTGSLTLRLQDGAALATGIRAAVTEFIAGGAVVASAAAPLGFSKEITGSWIVLPEPPKTTDPLELLGGVHDVLGHPRILRQGSTPWQLTAILYPEEVRWREEKLGWVFLVYRTEFKARKAMHRAYLARAARAGASDLAARVKALVPLAGRVVAQFGAGALGAPSALEFARAGTGCLRLLDGDIVEAGTVVRWPLGLSVAGRWKATTLAANIAANYPGTKVQPVVQHLGLPGNPTPDHEVIEAMLAGADLVFDATAEVGIQHLLSDAARVAGIPYLCTWATEGAWGGGVARIIPGHTEGCWFCLQLHLADGSIKAPPRDPDGLSQPAGCASPTFQGTAFDLGEISLMAVRIAVATLCGAEVGAYPQFDDDIALVTLREAAGDFPVPRWATTRLNKHPKCRCCS